MALTNWLDFHYAMNKGPGFPWYNIPNALVENGSFAGCLPIEGESAALTAMHIKNTDNIPYGISYTIIEAQVKGKILDSFTDPVLKAQLLFSGQPIGDILTSEDLTTSNAFINFGGSDKWGTDLTIDEVLSPSFGLMVWAESNVKYALDAIQIRFNTDEGTPTPVDDFHRLEPGGL